MIKQEIIGDLLLWEKEKENWYINKLNLSTDSNMIRDIIYYLGKGL